MATKTLEEVMKDINTRFKTKIINVGLVYEKMPTIPFSSPAMNYMLYGGLPMGRLVEFSGGEGGGKTTSALDIVASAQARFPDKQVLYVDTERTLDPKWATLIGVNIDELILLSPNEQTAEQIFEMVTTIIETGQISVCVIDSLAVMVSANAYKKSLEEKTYAGISGPLTDFGNQIVPICARTQTLLICINQLRDDFNNTYGGTKTPGGRAWKHLCTIRLEFMKSDFIDQDGKAATRSCENPLGNYVKCRLVKSKIFPPNRKIGYYTLKYLTGIDFITDLIDTAVKENNTISLAGAWYSLVADTGELFTDESGKPYKFQGKENLRKFLEENPQWLTFISDKFNFDF